MQIATSNGNRWPLIWRAERLMPYGTASDTARVYQTERLCYSAVLPLHAILSLFLAGVFGEFALKPRENFVSETS